MMSLWQCQPSVGLAQLISFVPTNNVSVFISLVCLSEACGGSINESVDKYLTSDITTEVMLTVAD